MAFCTLLHNTLIEILKKNVFKIEQKKTRFKVHFLLCKIAKFFHLTLLKLNTKKLGPRVNYPKMTYSKEKLQLFIQIFFRDMLFYKLTL